MKFQSDKHGTMPDLPKIAKITAWLATKFGNVSMRYRTNEGLQSYHMQDHPVKLQHIPENDSALVNALEVGKLINTANEKAKIPFRFSMKTDKEL